MTTGDRKPREAATFVACILGTGHVRKVRKCRRRSRNRAISCAIAYRHKSLNDRLSDAKERDILKVLCRYDDVDSSECVVEGLDHSSVISATGRALVARISWCVYDIGFACRAPLQPLRRSHTIRDVIHPEDSTK
jgi:hypothetical protein